MAYLLGKVIQILDSVPSGDGFIILAPGPSRMAALTAARRRRLDRGRVDWREVASLVERSYRLTAPKALLARLDGA